MASGSRVWSAYGFVATVGAAAVARKAINVTWKLSTGKTPPKNPAHPDVSMREAVAFATLSGMVVGLARMLASRKAAEYYRKSTGHLPANLQEVDV